MKPMHASIILLSCALTCFVSASALGQALNYTSVEAIAGKPVQLTYHAISFLPGARPGAQLHQCRGDHRQAGATDLSRRCA